ncbi:hypothetical protein CC80DRAFT_550467 [Byssothecium circinans]|uniref:Uncharacterized protein n=1 Tax=Byssothecium circinans TaxID=147558 RepID=A0A6A5TP66_9PLEO|nr:hypothetical protein CC80DRAFT_550467 [Byssothecium circinans]
MTSPKRGRKRKASVDARANALDKHADSKRPKLDRKLRQTNGVHSVNGICEAQNRNEHDQDTERMDGIGRPPSPSPPHVAADHRSVHHGIEIPAQNSEHNKHRFDSVGIEGTQDRLYEEVDDRGLSLPSPPLDLQTSETPFWNEVWDSPTYTAEEIDQLFNFTTTAEEYTAREEQPDMYRDQTIAEGEHFLGNNWQLTFLNNEHGHHLRGPESTAEGCIQSAVGQEQQNEYNNLFTPGELIFDNDSQIPVLENEQINQPLHGLVHTGSGEESNAAAAAQSIEYPAQIGLSTLDRFGESSNDSGEAAINGLSSAMLRENPASVLNDKEHNASIKNSEDHNAEESEAIDSDSLFGDNEPLYTCGDSELNESSGTEATKVGEQEDGIISENALQEPDRLDSSTSNVKYGAVDNAVNSIDAEAFLTGGPSIDNMRNGEAQGLNVGSHLDNNLWSNQLAHLLEASMAEDEESAEGALNTTQIQATGQEQTPGFPPTITHADPSVAQQQASYKAIGANGYGTLHINTEYQNPQWLQYVPEGFGLTERTSATDEHFSDVYQQRYGAAYSFQNSILPNSQANQQAQQRATCTKAQGQRFHPATYAEATQFQHEPATQAQVQQFDHPAAQPGQTPAQPAPLTLHKGQTPREPPSKLKKPSSELLEQYPSHFTVREWRRASSHEKLDQIHEYDKKVEMIENELKKHPRTRKNPKDRHPQADDLLKEKKSWATKIRARKKERRARLEEEQKDRAAWEAHLRNNGWAEEQIQLYLTKELGFGVELSWEMESRMNDEIV